ncbi:hypothetical protein [Microlunatus speluncae]|uniref:hypothetical protein n=1 Tax=Microlunatus speluncae TaxID=2594267 RepID=UPI0012661615|nr:hypothetical protein [Microlunatus speluncae]
MTRRSAARPIVIISGITVIMAAGATALAGQGGIAFTASSSIAQSVISIGVPMVTAVLGARCRGRAPLAVARLLPYVIGFAVIMAAVGVLITVVVTAAAGGTWGLAGPAVIGSFVAQSVAALIGLGLGTLIGRPVIADLMTIILPLGLLLLLGLIAPAAQPWLTPFPNASRWWSGTMAVDGLPPFLVMVLLWGVVLNAAGWIAQSRRRPEPTAATESQPVTAD